TAGTAADMFAWAATMGYAGTGRSPFGSDTLPAIIMRVLQEQPDLHELTGTLHEMAMACLAKDPAARPTAQEVLIRLLGNAPAAPMQALREGTVLAANIKLPSAAADYQPPLAAPPQPSPPPAYPSPQPSPPPAGSPAAAPWPGGGQPPVPPRQRSSSFTRIVAPIAAV